MRLLYAGNLPCLHIEPQVVQVLGDGRMKYVNLCHTWLQDGHKGVIDAFVEVRKLGRVSGDNRWLRVGPDFPILPSAATAIRVPHPWRRRKPRSATITAIQPTGPLEPIETEELIFDHGEVGS